MNDSQTKIPRLSVTPSELAASVGVGRDMVFDAIRNGKLVARKAGARTTLIELEEAQRWLKALPACRRSDLAVTAAA
jgi:excisionase family DNA binding protein